MKEAEAERVRDLLRTVVYPGYTRDIVGAGFVGDISGERGSVEVEFKPNTRDQGKIRAMEQAMREVLHDTGYDDVRIHHRHPFAAEMPIRSQVDLAADAGDPPPQVLPESGRLMTPLQAEMLEEGQLPEADVLGLALGRVDLARTAGYGPEGPAPLPGPREAVDYSCPLEVLQWSVDPHSPEAETCQYEIRLGEWEYRVWWQVHGCGDLLYVSMQAMCEDWVKHDEAAVPHPVGRAEAVNLVFDDQRNAVVAIYGTVRDFRPFVKAFWLALTKRKDEDAAAATDEVERK